MEIFTIKSDDKYAQQYSDDGIITNLLHEIFRVIFNSDNRNEMKIFSDYIEGVVI